MVSMHFIVMTCYSPNTLLVYSNSVLGKKKTRFFVGTDLNFSVPPFLVDKFYRDKNSPVNVVYTLESQNTIPCGHCIGCQLDKANMWKNRLMAEYRVSKIAYFLTITYADGFLPKNNLLCKSDIQKFAKSIKDYFLKHFGYKDIKYYIVGEYGSKSLRPHYHAIFFNLPLDIKDFSLCGINCNLIPDKDFYKCKLLDSGISTGSKIYKCKFLDNFWSRGNIIVGSVSSQSTAYCARYCNKKLNRESDEKELLKILKVQPEFLLCSKNLGTKYIFSKNLVNNKYYDNGKLVSGGRLGLKNLAEDLQKEIKVNNQYYFSINLASRYGDKNEMLKADSDIKALKIKTLKRNYN